MNFLHKDKKEQIYLVQIVSNKYANLIQIPSQ